MLAGLAVLSFIVSFVVIRVLLSRFGKLVLDEPNTRSLHERAVPRTGGIAVLVGTALSAAFGIQALWLPMVLAATLAVVSFLDDLYGMPTAARLLVHLAAAGALVWYILSPIQWATFVVLLMAVVWITNLYNFMDGSDGLAGGMSVIGFGAYSAAALTVGNAAIAALCIALAAASAAFLVHNFHPARIFLGDVGSIPLGFLAAALGVVGWRDDAWPLWFPVLVFGPFIADATVTLVKRALRGERVWRAHRSHYYQRMVQMGLGHRSTAYIGYLLMFLCAAVALFGRDKAPPMQAAAFGGASLILAGVAVWVDLRWARIPRGTDA